MKDIRKKKSSVIIIFVILVIWLVTGAVDFFRVSSFERPIFCIEKESVFNGAEDYKHYQGLGYSFETAENSSQSELPGVTRYTYFLFGKEMFSGIRD